MLLIKSDSSNHDFFHNIHLSVPRFTVNTRILLSFTITLREDVQKYAGQSSLAYMHTAMVHVQTFDAFIIRCPNDFSSV